MIDLEKYSGVRLLWASVIVQANVDIESGVKALLRSGKTDSRKTYVRNRTNDNYRKALRWLFVEDTGFGSFLWVCDTLDVDAYAIREKIAQQMITAKLTTHLHDAISGKWIEDEAERNRYTPEQRKALRKREAYQRKKLEQQQAVAA